MVKFSIEKRIETVNEIVKKQRSKIQISREFCISLPVIKSWVSRLEKHGIEGLLMKRGSYNGHTWSILLILVYNCVKYRNR
jgi:transposase